MPCDQLASTEVKPGRHLKNTDESLQAEQEKRCQRKIWKASRNQRQNREEVYSDYQQRIGALSEKLRQNEERRRKAAGLSSQIDAQRREYLASNLTSVECVNGMAGW